MSHLLCAKGWHINDFGLCRAWLEEVEFEVRAKLAAVAPVRREVVKLQESLCQELGLAEISCDRGWNIPHFRGCLQSFQTLACQHPDKMTVLRGQSTCFLSTFVTT